MDRGTSLNLEVQIKQCINEEFPLHYKSLPKIPYAIPTFDSTSDLESRLSLDTDVLTFAMSKGLAQKASINVITEPAAQAKVEKRPKLGRSNTVSERTRMKSSSPSTDDQLLQDEEGSVPKAPQERIRSMSLISASSPAGQRMSWAAGSPIESPSSSPEPADELTMTPTLTRDKGSRKGYSRFPKPSSKDSEEGRGNETARTTARAFNRASIFFTGKMKPRPAPVLGKLSTALDSDDSCASSSSSIAAATRNTDTPTSQSTSVSDLNSTTDASSLENSVTFERDPLVSVFKNLDQEAAKFEANAAPMFERMYAMKSALLVFLHQYTNHGTIKQLHTEDVERRAVVLNRWWIALLDLLESLGPHPTPGVDRVSLLEALTLIMMRPEWRHSTSVFLPLGDRSPSERVRARSSTQSSNSSDVSAEAALLTESAEHNVRSMFVANLVHQMDMVVRKMSQRPAPIGLVNFCGKACAYAFFLLQVHAAIQALAMTPPISDGVHGVDASATALPGLPADLFKSMSENRLIVLLKDILFDTSPAMAGPRHTFAEAFMADMKASAKMTAQFNYNACHTLCDFLEEALPIYDSAEEKGTTLSQYTDWPFWQRVCKLILESLNTMSEMKVLCLIYTIWDAATRTPERKEALCVDWLLSDATFFRLFNHWCPMVRSYFMRLLCWRVCRDDGRASALDRKIFGLVSARLRSVWATYLYVKQDAELKGRYPPSTAPCYPTPGKKFMIIRSEANAIATNSFAGFDATGKLPISDFPISNLGADDVLQSKPDGKKRWSLLGLNKVLSFKSDSKSPSDEEGPAVTALGEKVGSAPPPPPKGGNSSASSTGSRTPDPLSRSASPDLKSSAQYVFRFVLNWYPPAAVPTVNRVLARPRIPSPAQSWECDPTGCSGAQQESRTLSSTLARSGSGVSLPSLRLDLGDDDEGLGLDLGLDRPDKSVPETVPEIASPGGEPATEPVKPTGTQASTAAYSGRALAEWGIVVFECNNFVERRREEGVLGLAEVEVPTLALEGYRRIG
ncbi:unnamed protein product [Parascedosporium putredinis]|uniref:DUF1765-domain-containing protein n=1 Tax=Parascedosporium putredinis TaxID=1442378 RepID=A0A9P1H4P2_9PEZI|nr:unnamed protein product [Parascedosporium putredinis]CAI7998484.1 unnamed protein product [Parascedosporium putredinis]